MVGEDIKVRYMRPEDWTSERIDSLKDKDAADFIRAVVSSPYYDGYLAVLTTIVNINKELQSGVAKLVPETKVSDEGKLQILDKVFERSHKYITEMQPYYDQLEYFRKHLTPQELEEVAERAADLIDEARLKIKKNHGKN